MSNLQGTLLGFSKNVKRGELPPSHWQSIDNLLEHLENIGQPSMVVQLSQWFNNIFASDWQPIESVLPANTRTAAAQLQVFNQSERSVSRAKRIDLQLADRMLGLVVQVTATVTTEMDVRLRLYPADETIHLPASLQLIVLDELGVACMEAKARDADNWIQLEFGALPGENFTVTVALESESVTEKFAI